MARPQSPQEKKALAYERDVVDAWGENQKAFRKTWPKKKARLQRSYRREWRESLRSQDSDAIDDRAIRRTPHMKWTGPRLGEWVQNREERAERLRQDPRKSTEARERRRQRRT